MFQRTFYSRKANLLSFLTKSENFQSTISAKKLVKRNGCLQPPKCLVIILKKSWLFLNCIHLFQITQMKILRVNPWYNWNKLFIYTKIWKKSQISLTFKVRLGDFFFKFCGLPRICELNLCLEINPSYHAQF